MLQKVVHINLLFQEEVDYRVDYFANTNIGEQIIRAGDYAEGKEVYYRQVNVNVCDVNIEAVDISEYKLG